MGCMEAMMYLYSFVKELLAELCSKIEEVNVSVNNQKLRISIVLPSGHQFDPTETFFHNIWAVDTTGAQYGYSDPLCPWRDFEQSRSCKLNKECEFGYIRHQVYQSYGMFPMRYIVTQTIEKVELTKALEEMIPMLPLSKQKTSS
ncbi:hypothetical protein DL95DRAFT_399012 [Leptodontidium sp. 2 PMI_412]|nr:hypothetical protein DL95DRAFT_399012 [Leptodontidium sp. 2 PMI_412]